MIELIATAESMAQAEELLAVGVDTLYICLLYTSPSPRDA